MWHMDDGWGWWMASGWVWMIVLWGLIIWGIARIVGANSGDRHEATTEATPLEILQRRYARGELTDEQFEAMRRRLAKGPTIDDATRRQEPGT